MTGFPQHSGKKPDFLRALNQRDCACNIDPSASSYAIMRRAGPYRGENSGPGKDDSGELDTERTHSGAKRTSPAIAWRGGVRATCHRANSAKPTIATAAMGQECDGRGLTASFSQICPNFQGSG